VINESFLQEKKINKMDNASIPRVFINIKNNRTIPDYREA